MKKIAIIGGGITGLSAAFYLQKWMGEQQLPIDITLFEASDCLGGKVQTTKRDGFVIEHGADSFLARKKPGMQLMEDLGLEDQLYRNETGQSYVLVHNQLHPIPAGSYMGIPVNEEPFLASDIVSENGKIRALAELSQPKGSSQRDQSLGAFLRRRFGDELVDHLLAPLLSGIYSSNIDDMSLMASFPNFYELEQTYGSVLKGLREQLLANRNGTGKKSGQFVSLEGGLTSMIDALEEKLSRIIQKDTAIQQMNRIEDTYVLHDQSGNRYEADGIIAALPHKEILTLFEQKEVFAPLESIPVSSVANVALAFDRKDIAQVLDGTGFVVSKTSDVRITACTWTHEKWPATTPADKALLRVYVGRPDDQEIVLFSDEALIDIVLEDLKKVMNIQATPQFSVVTRWQQRMPQYVVGHKEKLAKINNIIMENYPGVLLAGASYQGVGLPDCIEQGKQRARQLVDYLRG